MTGARKSFCALVVLAIFVAPSLSGCAGSESAPASAEARSGVLAGFVEQLKREDDENEVKEKAEHEETQEEREGMQERAEGEEAEQAQAEQAPPSET